MPEHNKKHNEETATFSDAVTREPEQRKSDVVPLRKEFFWKVPGDVPGARRSWPGLLGGGEVKKTNTRFDNSGFETTKPGDTAQRVAPEPAAIHDRKEKSSPVKPGWIMLLFLVVFIGAGYSYFSDNAETPVVLNTVQAVVQPEVNKPVIVEKVKLAEVQEVANESVSQQQPQFITHVVVKGDTLWDIAEKYLGDPFRYPELAELSNIKDPHWIYPGDIIRIPV